jgi:hypothetical protein
VRSWAAAEIKENERRRREKEMGRRGIRRKRKGSWAVAGPNEERRKGGMGKRVWGGFKDLDF